MIRDHFRGANIFDINAQEKIAYAKALPYQYATIATPFVAEPCVDIIRNFECSFANPRKELVGIQTYNTTDDTEPYGYEIILNDLQYNYEQIKHIIGEEPERIKQIKEAGLEFLLHTCYFLADGTPKYLGLKVRTKHLEKVAVFSDLENFEEIRKPVLDYTGIFPGKYWIDLQNPERFSLFIISPTPERLTDRDVYARRNETFYINQKVEYYNNFVNYGMLTDQQYNFIIESSPRMQQTMLKYLWVDGKINKMELESTCVFDFEDV